MKLRERLMRKGREAKEKAKPKETKFRITFNPQDKDKIINVLKKEQATADLMRTGISDMVEGKLDRKEFKKQLKETVESYHKQRIGANVFVGLLKVLKAKEGSLKARMLSRFPQLESLHDLIQGMSIMTVTFEEEKEGSILLGIYQPGSDIVPINKVLPNKFKKEGVTEFEIEKIKEGETDEISKNVEGSNLL